MKWKNRLREIERLQRKHGRRPWTNKFPDLKVELRGPPCSNAFAPVMGKRGLHPDAKVFPVGANHKQGSELLTPMMIKNDLRHMGGKKPN